MAQLTQPRPMARARQIDLPQILAYALLTLGAVTMVVPFFWMISTSMKTVAEILKPQFFPSAPTLDNYVTVMTRTLFPTWYLNSLLAATASTLSVAFFDSLVGYVFAKFEFPLKKVFFVLVLMTLMVPTEMLVIPWYIMAVGVKLQDSLLLLIDLERVLDPTTIKIRTEVPA